MQLILHIWILYGPGDEPYFCNGSILHSTKNKEKIEFVYYMDTLNCRLVIQL